MQGKKVGFIYLDELHHIHHFIGPASELSKNDKVQVDILTYEDDHLYLKQLVNALAAKKLNVLPLKTTWTRRILEKIKKRHLPSFYYIYKKHINKFLSYDALVFTDHTADIIYKAREKVSSPKLIHIAHGSGDGSYGYQRSHELYDLILVAGEKKENRLRNEFVNSNLNIKIVGYPKFDLLNQALEKPPLFDSNTKPIILYTPHFKKGLSSWYKFGNQILDFFVLHQEYNLIFAPHINLFNKKGFEDKGSLDKKYFNAPNIHIDLGSISSIDMTYTQEADMYLGDVSSQVYEFLFEPKPAIFVNAHTVDWENDPSYLLWQTGEVIPDLSNLKSLIENSSKWSKRYEQVQRDLFNKTFNLIGESSSKRVAQAILEELNFNQ